MCIQNRTTKSKPALFRQSGVTLIELIIFIVIVGVAVAGVMVTYSTVVRSSADPLIRKQALALAESLLLEIEDQDFNYCDPQDANFQAAINGTQCAGKSQDILGPTTLGEKRGDPTNAFDNVGDYHGYAANPLPDIRGQATINGYAGSVVITQVGGTAPFDNMPLEDALRIEVTVTGPGNESITLVGFRTRFAPYML